jgi:hypothetical protein
VFSLDSYLEEALHSLQPTYHPEIESILKRTQDDDSTRQKQARMAAPRVSLVNISHHAQSQCHAAHVLPRGQGALILYTENIAQHGCPAWVNVLKIQG